MKRYYLLILTICVAICTSAVAQEESFEVETTRIQTNQELPKILYVVPWKDVTGGTNQTQQKLSLHDFFGDLYEPLIPSKAVIQDTPTTTADATKAKEEAKPE